MFLYEDLVLLPASDSPVHYFPLFLALLSGLLCWSTHIFFFFYVKNGLYMQCSSFLSLLLVHRKAQKSFGNLSNLIPCLSNLVWSLINTALLKIYGISVHQIMAHSVPRKITTTVLFEIGLSPLWAFHASVENVIKILRIAFVWLNGSQCFCSSGDIWRCLETFFGCYSCCEGGVLSSSG